MTRCSGSAGGPAVGTRHSARLALAAGRGVNAPRQWSANERPLRSLPGCVEPFRQLPLLRRRAGRWRGVVAGTARLASISPLV
jgi:hypothetical protein